MPDAVTAYRTVGELQAAAVARAETASAAVDEAVLVARSLAHALARVHRELGHLGHHED